MTRITISFIEAPRLARVILLMVGGTAAVLAVLALWLARDAMQTRSERPVLVRRLSNLERERQTTNKSGQAPTFTELEAMRSRVARLNAVSMVRGWSSADVLGWLEAHMSDEVHLVSIHHKTREAELLLVAEAENATVLTEFLSILEHEPQFSEVLLSKQGSHAEQAGRSVQFEIKIRLKV